MRLGAEDQVGALFVAATNGDGFDDSRMEAVFILSEINSESASTALRAVAAVAGLSSEVRCAAAWGLGQGALADPHAVADLIADPDDDVALHAAASITDLDDGLAGRLADQLHGDDRLAEVAAALLLRHGRITELLAVAQSGGPGAMLALRALGDVPPAVVEHIGGPGLVAELSQMLGPLWRSQTDWIRQGGDEDLEMLDAQRLRF